MGFGVGCWRQLGTQVCAREGGMMKKGRWWRRKVGEAKRTVCQDTEEECIRSGAIPKIPCHRKFQRNIDWKSPWPSTLSLEVGGSGIELQESVPAGAGQRQPVRPPGLPPRASQRHIHHRVMLAGQEDPPTSISAGLLQAPGWVPQGLRGLSLL